MTNDLTPGQARAKWYEALESGQYRQGYGALHMAGAEQDSFCCLGVACKVAVDHGVIPEPARGDSPQFTYGTEGDTESMVLPRAVRDWLGLPSTDPSVEAVTVNDVEYAELHGVDIEPDTYAVAELNDSYSLTFPEIAAALRESYPADA